jgi:hypothetical protein
MCIHKCELYSSEEYFNAEANKLVYIPADLLDWIDNRPEAHKVIELLHPVVAYGIWILGTFRIHRKMTELRTLWWQDAQHSITNHPRKIPAAPRKEEIHSH